MIQQLPLFPLGTILFPGGTINLHIFEERYRQMIARCLEQHAPFGVVLIRDGDEVVEGRLGARAADPYTVGTIAAINANVRLEDGRYLLTATGLKRFRIQYVVQRAPYIVAAVVQLPDEHGSTVSNEAAELRTLYERYWQAVASATGVPVKAEELPDDPLAMAYHLADRLQVPAAQKQRWLEADLRERVSSITTALREELALLPRAGTRPTGEGWGGMGSLN
jgi:Lon protease-like protein